VLKPAWCLLVAAAVAPSRSAAATPRGQWAERPFAADAVLGFATPVGEAGGTVDYALVPRLSLGGGVGTNLQGLQLAGGARFRFTPQRPASLFAGAWYSQGPFDQGVGTRYGIVSAVLHGAERLTDHARPTPWRRWDQARWVNLELGGEERRPGGFDARGFCGVALLLNPKSNREQLDVVVDHGPAPDVVPVLLYVGAAFGFSL
jgi:hypothetical protein